MKPTLILKAPELRKYARKIADAIARAHGPGCCVVPRPAPNPTLVAHGLVKASLWHITTADPPIRAVADLYVGSKTEAARVTRLLANLLKSRSAGPMRLRLLDNTATPAELKGHPSVTVEANPSRSKAARARRRATRAIRKRGRTAAQRAHKLASHVRRGIAHARSMSESYERSRAFNSRRANPKGRNARPTTVREAVAQVLAEAKFPQLVKEVRSGKADPLAALQLARKFMQNEHQRAIIDRAIRLVRKVPGANPSRTKTARARRKGRVLSHRQRRSLAKAGFQKSAQTRHLIIGQIQRGTRRGLPHGRRANPKGRVSLDAATRKHLDAWLKANRRGGYVTARTKIYWALHQYPELIEQGRSWAEIERIGEDAERNPNRARGRGRAQLTAGRRHNRSAKHRHLSRNPKGRKGGIDIAAYQQGYADCEAAERRRAGPAKFDPLRGLVGNPKRRNPIPRSIDRRSIRTIKRGGKSMLVGCPKGHYQPRKARCLSGTRRVNRRKGGARRTTGHTRRTHARVSNSVSRRRPNPASREKAAELVRMFEDRGPIKVRTKRMKAPAPLKGAVAKIGDVVAIAYRSKKFHGNSTDYEHKFKSPKPVLVADPETGDLNIVRGKSPYDLTPDGIIN